MLSSSEYSPSEYVAQIPLQTIHNISEYQNIYLWGKLYTPVSITNTNCY